MKKLVLIIVVVIILLVAGYFGYIYLSKPKLISSNSEPVVVCSDTDGNNIYEQGISSYKYADGTQRGSQDACDYSQRSKPRVGLVREGYCKDNQYSCGWEYIYTLTHSANIFPPARILVLRVGIYLQNG